MGLPFYVLNFSALTANGTISFLVLCQDANYVLTISAVLMSDFLMKLYSYIVIHLIV